MDFKNIPNKYRPMPFWSWNEKLDTEETANQIELMNDAGIGGFVMHARCGLQTEYMGEEWFRNVSCSVDKSKELGMFPWVYDENGWPSGFGNGKVNGKGEKYQQKHLRMEKGEKQTPHTICNVGGFHFYYDVNPFYVDTLDGEVTEEFIKEVYEPYYEKYQNDIKGFFTDEPQIANGNIPWSLKLPAEYKEAYGEELTPVFCELFTDVGDYKNTRIKFWKLVTDLFSKNYLKKLYDWCLSHNMELTGHLLYEGTLKEQLLANGAAMPHYEYFTIPGMDWLGRNIRNELHCRQVGSAAQQLGKKQVLTESFGLCGHNTSFEEYRRLIEWQMVRGVNILCQHLEGYSLRGMRKRDYPPTVFYQQPWWNEYKTFNDAISREGMILAEGTPCCDTLLIHPQTTAWSMFNNGENKGLDELNKAFIEATHILERKHTQFHLGDETLLERHGHIEGNALVIGEMRYTTVIVLPDTILFDSTKELLSEYGRNGGKFVTAEELPENVIIDNPNITYTIRKYDGFDVHFFVNSTEERQKSYISKGSKIVDITTGELKPFSGYYEFQPFDSLVVIDDGTSRKDADNHKELKELPIAGEWKIVNKSPNVLSLDYCKYSFDGEVIEENGYVLNIQERATMLKCPVKIKQEFEALADYVPEELYLVIETPELFNILINGTEVDKTDCGYFIDKSFRKIRVDKYFGLGKNIIEIECDFKQSDVVYENIEKAMIFESERNKLTYDIEIEPIYLVGDFEVSTDGEFEALDKKSVRYSGAFKICKPKKTLIPQNLEKNGFPFFAGSITLEKTITVDDINQKIVFDKKGTNVIMVSVNDREAGTLLWNPTELDLSDYLTIGENTIKVTLINNLRNMLGPHHLEQGESCYVSVSAFYKENRLWASLPEWNDDYCLVEFGIF